MYKLDTTDPNATSRNPNTITLKRVIDAKASITRRRVIMYSDHQFSATSNSVEVIIPDTSSKRAQQIYNIFSAQTLITGLSGLAMMSIFGATRYWHHNAMTFLVKYPITSAHLFSPKNIKLRKNEADQGLSRSALARFLLHDWTSLFDYCIINELSYKELSIESSIFARIQCGDSRPGDIVDIVPTLLSNATNESSLHAFPGLPSRYVSLRLFHSLRCLLSSVAL